MARTAQEAAQEMEALGASHGDDPEVCHDRADEILLRCLEGLGFDAVSAAYRKLREDVQFWYA